MSEWKVGSIAQIDPEHDEVFGGCLMKVTEVRDWGLLGYFDVPGKGHAHYRVKYENCVHVGFCEWIWEPKEDKCQNG